MDMLEENGQVDEVLIRDEVICISHSANTFGKSINLTNLHLAVGKRVGQIRFFSFGMATGISAEKKIQN